MKDLNEEIIKKTAEVYKENLENLTLPTSRSIGNNLGLMVDGVFGWFGVWGEIQIDKQKKYKEDFKMRIKEGISEIPEDKIIEPKANIILPALESAKYYFEEEYYKDMFAKLIIDSCNKQKVNEIHPSFIETIKQLAPLDAKILNMFKYNKTYPTAEIKAMHNDNTETPCTKLLCDFKDKDNEFSYEEKLRITMSIDNLVRLGILHKSAEIIELNYNYDNFKDNFIYKSFEKMVEEESKIKIKKYRIQLTSYGESFFDICIK